MSKTMSDSVSLQWMSQHILPLEAEVRGWLGLHARTLSKADVDDVIQEAYARIWKAGIHTITQPRAYFYTAVRNLLCEQARRARIVPMERMGEIDSLRIISAEPGPDQRANARQELAQLLAAMAELPPQCRRAFQLRKLDGLSQRDVAAAMGIAEKTVEKHLMKALLRIADAMARTRQTGGSSENKQHDSRHKRD